MDESIVFPIYVVVKYAAYSAWCYYGVRLLRDQSSTGSAIALGSARLGLSMIFGLAIFFVGGAVLHLGAPTHPWLMYFSIYMPVRYLEWSILAALLIHGGTTARRLGESATQQWIVGGIVVSHLADLPLILFTYGGAKGFLPIGRFLC